MIRNILFIILTLTALACYAAIYMQTDKSGNTTYTDTPSENSRPVSVSDQNMISAPDTTPAAPAQQMPISNEATKIPYQSFAITSPADQETIQNQPSFSVKFDIQPELQNGDSIQLFIDGSPWGSPVKKPEILVTQLERGTHKLNANLLDANQSIQRKSQTITVYIHRASSNFTPS
jgi:hypothetical protein